MGYQVVDNKCDYAEGDKYEKCRNRCPTKCGKKNDKCPYTMNKETQNGQNKCPYEEKKEYAKCNTKAYTDCACQAKDCPYSYQAEEQRKRDKKKADEAKMLVVNRKNIRRTKIGKFTTEVYPKMERKLKADKDDDVIIATCGDDTTDISSVVEFEVGEGHFVKRLRDLDDMKKWKFIDRSGKDVYEEVLDYISDEIETTMWTSIDTNNDRIERMRKAVNKSIKKAIRRKKFSFRKLEDILDGHSFWIEDEKQNLKEDIIGEVNEYLVTFTEGLKSKDEEDDDEQNKNNEVECALCLGCASEISMMEWDKFDGMCENCRSDENSEISDDEKALKDEMKRETQEEIEDFQAEAEYVREWSNRHKEESSKKMAWQHGLDEYGQPTDESE